MNSFKFHFACLLACLSVTRKETYFKLFLLRNMTNDKMMYSARISQIEYIVGLRSPNSFSELSASLIIWFLCIFWPRSKWYGQKLKFKTSFSKMSYLIIQVSPLPLLFNYALLRISCVYMMICIYVLFILCIRIVSRHKSIFVFLKLEIKTMANSTNCLYSSGLNLGKIFVN